MTDPPVWSDILIVDTVRIAIFEDIHLYKSSKGLKVDFIGEVRQINGCDTLIKIPISHLNESLDIYNVIVLS